MSKKLTTKQVLKKAYNREYYLNFLRDKFNFSEFIQAVPINNNEVKSFEQLGFISIATSDDKLPVFEIHIKPKTKLERNRVQLRNLVAKQDQTKDGDGAIAVYVDDKNKQWRFSFIAIEYKLGDDGIKKEQTASKRFTYLFGEGAKTRTALQRFKTLNQQSKLKDLKTAFAVEGLNKEFYGKLYKWYEKAQTAQTQVIFPNDNKAENHTKTSLIRFLTRILFVWFLKEKKLINADLFDLEKLKDLINYEKDSSFYKAILQNLFFATLNRQITNRGFRRTTDGKANNTNYLATNIYRYQDYFTNNDEQKIMALFNQIPFLNGGLFECLDREATDEEKQQYEQDKSIRKVQSAIRIDGFSDKPNNELKFDNQLLFNDDENDLGLIDLFNQYQFTIEESTPADIEVALDPELLGKVFENLLATYNPETGDQARKVTGSFYTPREIVSYMVDESLKQHFKTHTDLDEAKINALFIEGENTFNEQQIKSVINAIDTLKILDPAVGSGAYPMGVLQRLVLVLDKIDHENKYFKQQQLDKTQTMEEASRKASVEAIEQIFSTENQHNTYGKKLMLIENCIYGVDIQPIAIQICKLRFFISLTIEQEKKKEEHNFGITPLPNLETKFIVANTLLTLGEKPQQVGLYDTNINNLKEDLAKVRHQYFTAKTLKTKRKYREQDKDLRKGMLATLTESGITPAVEKSMKEVVDWDLYNQNSQSDWFDPEWMFGIKEGFDIVIGNPPYIDSESMVKNDKKIRESISRSYLTTKGNWDIYIAFFEFGFNSLNSDGVLTFITPDKWISKPFGYELRKKLMDNLKIILNSGRQVFETAKVDSIVTFFTKKHCNSLLVLNFKDNEISIKNKIIKSNISEPFSFDFVFSNHLSFLNKIDLLPLKVSDSFECENACATSDAYKLKDFVKNSVGSVGGNYLKIINTGTIGKYTSKWGIKEMTYLGNKYLSPIVKKEDFLEQFGNSYSKKSIKPKIIIKGLTLLDSCLDEKGVFIPGKSTLIVANDNIEKLKFLLGLLNSRLVIFYIKEKHPASSYNQGINFTKHMINNMPIQKTSKAEQQSFIKLVNKIIQAKQDGKDTTDYEAQIDELVYKLYNLSPTEIKIIKQSS
jgi:hypothetical protein